MIPVCFEMFLALHIEDTESEKVRRKLQGIEILAFSTHIFQLGERNEIAQ